MFLFWSTTTLAPGPASASARSISPGRLATSLLNSAAPSGATAQARWDDFPTSKPTTAAEAFSFFPMVYPFRKLADRGPRARQPHYGAVGDPRHVSISRRPRRPVPGGNTPRAFARGRAKGPSGAVGQRPLGAGSNRIGKQKEPTRGPAQTVMGLFILRPVLLRRAPKSRNALIAKQARGMYPSGLHHYDGRVDWI